MIKNFIQAVFGILTFILCVYNWRASKLRSGGIFSPRCFNAFWLRHIVLAHKSNLNYYPNVVVDPGPGDSLGERIMALMLGSKIYIACDGVEFLNIEKNLIV
jgi:hypothetical protein